MAIQNEPTRIQIPFADSGTKNVIPDTNSTPSASQAASWTDGFPAQCSLPLSAGGIPPARADFNGIFNTMSQSLRYGQEGGVWAWDATVDYGTNRLVLGSDGLLYWSIAQSGPNVGGAKNPTTDSGTYWKAPYAKTVPLLDSSNAIITSRWIKNAIVAQCYVNPSSGNDSNDGLSSSTAVKTIARALSIFNSLPAKRTNYDFILHLASGTYAESLDLGESMVNLVLGGDIEINGMSLMSNSVCVCGDVAYTITVNGDVEVRDGSVIKFGCSVDIQGGTFVLRSGASVQVLNLSIAAPSGSTSALYLLYDSNIIVNGTLTASNSNGSSVVFCTHSSVLEVVGATSLSATSNSKLISNDNGSWIGLRGGVTCSGSGNTEVVVFSRAKGLFYGGLTISSGVASSIPINITECSCLSLSGTSTIYSSSGCISVDMDSLVVCNGETTLHGGSGSIIDVRACSSFILAKNINMSLIADSSCYYAIICRQCSCVTINDGGTLSFSGSFSSAVVLANSNGMIDITQNKTLSGSPSGVRYSASTGGQILTHGGGASRIPGTSAGTAQAATYGCYS